MNLPIYVMIGLSCLTWLILLLAIIKFWHYFSEFEKFKSRNDVELNNAVWHLKRAEETREKMLVEMRRIGKLLYDIYKGNRTDYYSEAEYVQEDSLRHHKSDEVHSPGGVPHHNGPGGDHGPQPSMEKVAETHAPPKADPVTHILTRANIINKEKDENKV